MGIFAFLISFLILDLPGAPIDLAKFSSGEYIVCAHHENEETYYVLLKKTIISGKPFYCQVAKDMVNIETINAKSTEILRLDRKNKLTKVTLFLHQPLQKNPYKNTISLPPITAEGM